MNPGEDIRTRLAAPWALPALVLWGWQVDLWGWGLLMGVLIEARRLSSFRFDISPPDFNRFWNFNAILFVGTAMYLFFAREGPSNIGALVAGGTPSGRLDGAKAISATALTFLRWLPFIFYPMVLAHAWSRTPTLPWSTFSLYQQKRARNHPTEAVPDWANRPVHPAYPYTGIVLLASTASTTYPALYLSLLSAVVAALLWPTSNTRFRVLTRLGIFGGILALVLAANQSLGRFRDIVQALENRLLQGGGDVGFDQTLAYTALGNVGRLKQSSSIVLRIASTNSTPPGLLREATFNRFRAKAWSTSHREFIPIDPTSTSNRIWQLLAQSPPTQALTVSRYTANGSAPLALPDNTVAVSGIPVVQIEINSLGSARLKDALPIAIYTVALSPIQSEPPAYPPEAEDLELDGLSDTDSEAIQQVAHQLGLNPSIPHREAIAAVEKHFASGFTYSLWQEPNRKQNATSPLAKFLLSTKSGHCEFYATATTLLLRTAKIPTRYAVGYSPGDRGNHGWIARGRDAHAWCRAFVDGHWVDIDTTPGIWRAEESRRRDFLEPLRDGLSQARFRFAAWRQTSDRWRLLTITAGVIGLGWLAWRQLRGSQWRRLRGARAKLSRPEPVPGLDSEFYAVVRMLEKTQGERIPHETLPEWVRRVVPNSHPARSAIFEALQLHQQLRFDPVGLPSPDRRRLAKIADTLTRSENGLN